VGEQVAFLEGHPEAGAVFTMAQSIDENGVAGRVYSLPPELRRECSSLYGFDDIFRVLLKYGNFFFCPGVMARTPIYRDLIRVWDASGFGTSADLDVWLRILRQFPVGIIDKPLLRYRGAAATSFSYSHAREKTAPADMLKVFNSYISGSSGHLMGKEEHADYALLILKDNINRAFNLLCNGDAKAGRALLSGLFSLDNVTHSFRSYFHLRALLYGYSVYFLSWLPLGRKTLGFVSYFRFRK